MISETDFFSSYQFPTLYLIEVEDVEKPLEHTQYFDNAYVPISREEEVMSS